MKRIGRFGKVKFDIFQKYCKDHFIFSNSKNEEDDIKNSYENIKLPKRATTGSAGYDIYPPMDFYIAPGNKITIPLGINVEMEPGWVFSIYPRSSTGIKLNLSLLNTVGIIDSDYINSDNNGHIMAVLKNNGSETVHIDKNKPILQGIFTEFGITFDDEVSDLRNGGIGSTSK